MVTTMKDLQGCRATGTHTAGENRNGITILENSLEIVYEVKFIL